MFLMFLIYLLLLLLYAFSILSVRLHKPLTRLFFLGLQETRLFLLFIDFFFAFTNVAASIKNEVYKMATKMCKEYMSFEGVT